MKNEERKNLVADMYQFTMGNVYYNNNDEKEIAIFDMFYRKNPDGASFAIANGLEDVIDYIKNLKFTDSDIEYFKNKGIYSKEFIEYLKNFKFTGDIYGIPTGTVVFPNEPLLTVKAPIIEAQIIETMILLKMNHQSLITTKANRIVRAASGRGVMEFGTRRSHGEDAAITGAKCAYIAGAIGTACVQADKDEKIPALGTMAHSSVQWADTEYEAFKNYAKTFPNNTTLLVDTYDTLKSGIPNAIKLQKEYLEPMGCKLKGIRIDSGDLAYLSKEARRMFDEAGMDYVNICVSNSLDEYVIEDLIKNQGAEIDLFGVGERLITAKSEPVFGGVYKLAGRVKEGNIIPKIKISNDIGKVINPGFKKTIRFYNNEGYAIGDIIAFKDEEIPMDNYKLTKEDTPWVNKEITDYKIRELQVPIFINGELVYNTPTTEETREYLKREVETIYEEYKRFKNPQVYPVDISDELYDLKRFMIKNTNETAPVRKLK